MLKLWCVDNIKVLICKRTHFVFHFFAIFSKQVIISEVSSYYNFIKEKTKLLITQKLMFVEMKKYAVMTHEKGLITMRLGM